MPQLLRPKHQKLVLQCYPPGRDIDKKPNSSELNYLLYYCSTRRIKLEKIGTFLEKKTNSDLHHYSRYGNVQVTLLILKNMIEKCYDNLNLFADNCLKIFHNILTLKDLILIQLTLKVFKTLCEHLDNNLFIGNPVFNSLFMETSELFLNLSNQNKDKNNQWKIISIKAAKYLNNISKLLNVEENNLSYITNKSLTLILTILNENFTSEDLKDKLTVIESSKMLKKSTSNNELTVQKTTTSLRRSLSLTNNSVANNIDEENDRNTEDNINIDTDWNDLECAEDALASLKVYFSSNIGYQLIQSLRSLTSFICNNNNNKTWYNYLIQIIVNYVPVQLRFMVLTNLLQQLINLSEDKKNNNLKTQIIISFVIEGLLNSNVNMIGLSILDILKKLLILQMNLKIINIKDSQAELTELKTNYIHCVSSLSNHIYYYDQISDIIEEILIKIEDCFSNNEDEQILILFRNINEILNNSIKKPANDSSNEDGIEVYGGDNSNTAEILEKTNNNPSYGLIKQKSSIFITAWLNLSNYLNHYSLIANHQKIYIDYYKILSTFLIIELEGYEKEQEDENHSLVKNLMNILNSIDNKDPELSLTSLNDYITTISHSINLKSEHPNFESLILNDHTYNQISLSAESSSTSSFNNHNNYLTSILENFNKVLSSSSKNPLILQYAYFSGILLIEIYGINFFFNFLNYFLTWQQNDNLLTDSFAFSLLFDISQYLKNKYGIIEFFDNVNDKIQQRIRKDLWDSLIPKPRFIKLSSANIDFSFTKDQLLSLLDEYEITHKWISETYRGNKPLVNDQANSAFPTQKRSRAITATSSLNILLNNNHSIIQTNLKANENASLFSASKIIANLNQDTSSRFPSFNNLKPPAIVENGTSIKVHDLKSMISGNNLSKSVLQDELLDEKTLEDSLIKLIDGLVVNQGQLSSKIVIK